MPLCNNLCASNMVAHTLNACNDFKKGDASAVSLIFCEVAYNKVLDSVTGNDATIWQGILSDPDDAVVINRITVARTSEISELENPVANGEDNIQDGINYTITLTDPNVSCDNNDFYQRLNGRSAYIAIAYQDGRLEISEVPFTIKSKLPNIEKGALQVYEVSMQRKFNKNKTWRCFNTTPAGIFNLT